MNPQDFFKKRLQSNPLGNTANTTPMTKGTGLLSGVRSGLTQIRKFFLPTKREELARMEEERGQTLVDTPELRAEIDSRLMGITPNRNKGTFDEYLDSRGFGLPEFSGMQRVGTKTVSTLLRATGLDDVLNILKSSIGRRVETEEVEKIATAVDNILQSPMKQAQKSREIQTILTRAEEMAKNRASVESYVTVVKDDGSKIFYRTDDDTLSILRKELIDGTERGVAGIKKGDSTFHLTAKTPSSLLRTHGFEDGGSKTLAQIQKMIQGRSKRVPIRDEDSGQFLGSFTDEDAFKKFPTQLAESEQQLIDTARLFDTPEDFIKEIEVRRPELIKTVDEVIDIDGVTSREGKLTDEIKEFVTDLWKRSQDASYKGEIDKYIFNRSLPQIEKQLFSIFGRKIDIFTTTKSRRLGDAGALGVTDRSTGLIGLLRRNGQLSEAIANHEGWHWFKSQLSSTKRAELEQMEVEFARKFPDRIKQLERDYPRPNGFTDAQYEKYLAEEAVADEFARFYRTGETVWDKLTAFFERALTALRTVFQEKDVITNDVRRTFSNVKGILDADTGADVPATGSVFKKSEDLEKIARGEARIVSRDGQNVYQQKNLPEVEEAISQIDAELQYAGAGIAQTEDGYRRFTSIPHWIPDEFRDMDLLNRAMKHVEDGTTPRSNATRLREAVEMLDKEITDRANNIKKADTQADKAQTKFESSDYENDIARISQAQREWAETAETGGQLVTDIEIPQGGLSLEEIVTQTPVSKKVNLLDYVRTPDRVLRKIGFAKEADLLRTKYDDYAKELPKNLDIITSWSKRVPNSGENLFRYLDGQEVTLSAEEQAVANEMRQYLKDWADRLKLPEESRIQNYITHLFDDQLIEKEFDEDLAKIITEKVPGEVYNPFLEKRLGKKGYKKDVWLALDAYTKRATRKVHIDEALQKIQDKAGSDPAFSNIELSQFNYIKRYVDRVNMRPTELDNLLDNAFKQVFGYKLGQRPVMRVLQALRRATYRGMLGLNIGSALRNLSQGVNTYATLGEKYTFIGYAKLFNKQARQELVEEGIFDNNIIQDRAISATKKTLEKADKALWLFFDTAEKINRGSAYFGAKSKALAQGKSEAEARKYGKEIMRKTQFQYDSVDTPVALGSDIVKSLAQFQTFTTKQLEFLGELAKDRNFMAFVRYGLAGYLFVHTIGKAMGMEEEELIPMYRFGVPPSLQFPVESVKALMGTEDEYGNERTLTEKIKDVGKSALGLIPGGMQMKKTVQGAQAVDEGGSFDKAGREQFEVGGSPAKDIQAFLFGKYANPEAKDYFNKETGDKTLDGILEKENESRKDVNTEARKALNEFNSLTTQAEKRRFVTELAESNPDALEKMVDMATEQSLNLTDTEKSLKNASVSARVEYIKEEIENYDSREEKREFVINLVEKGIITESVIEALAQ